MLVRDLRFRLARRLARRGLPHEHYRQAGARLVEGRTSFKYVIDEPCLDDPAVWLRNQELVRALADRAGAEPFVVEEPENGAALLGISSQGLRRLAQAVRDAAERQPLHVIARFDNGRELNGLAYQQLGDDLEGLRSLGVFQNYRDTRTGRRYARRHACTIEAWDKDDSGGLLAPSLNARVSAVPVECRELDHVVPVHGMPMRTFAPLAEPDPFTVEFPIDAVYLWVDGDDPHWRRRRAARLESVGSTPDEASLDAVRFEQGDELRYSLRSLCRYAPWIRRIFLVTDQQRPAWLQEIPGELDVIDHAQILPASVLPTYNSHAITAAVHNIPGLSDRFLLFNDDVLFGRPVRAHRFFYSNGATKFFTSRSALPAVSPNADESPLVGARRRSQELIEKLTARRPNYGFKHTPVPFSRELLEELERELPAWRETLASPFRSANDIVPSWVHHYVGYDRSLCFPGDIKYSYFDIGDAQAVSRLRQAFRKERPHVFCVNDVTEELIDGRSRHQALCEILEAAFPWPSPFENDRRGEHDSG